METAFKNVLIKPISSDDIQQGALLIRDGKIVAFGQEEEIDLTSCTNVIDGQGCLLTPGLIDAHTHLGVDEEGIGWEGADFNETSDPVTPHVRALDGINPFEQGFFDAAKAGVTTVQVLPGSANVIGGLTAVVKVKPGGIVQEITLRETAGLKMALGENPKKFHGKEGRPPKTRMGTAAIIRREFANALRSKREPHDLKLSAYHLVLDKQIPVRVHAHRADDIMTALRIADEFDLDITIEHVTEGHLIASHLAESRARFSVGPTLSNRSKVELNHLSWDVYSELDANGIRFAMITDHPVLPISQIATSAQQAVKAGLKEEKAWRSLTIHPAENLCIQHRTGSIETGKDADLTLWDKNPITDHGQPLVTMVEGNITYQK
ncbi:amidohydrolase [Halobacillus salinarum]|uniref:Amidohydrolase n=1 Tax=Halobacillus salinarum TaxID=2932257 RepID=A0ABY4EGK2_9BACI|nr:amidohydrolase [Halobacillus salinarum]UOQ43575.1 amidohydrolase [Halobacillus salinarum]